jgi:precorrin-8X/cobalt-precorrin-8 methylmutase
MKPYLKDPAAIYAKSFALVREQAGIAALPCGLAEVAQRLIHSCGMPDIIDDLEASPDFAANASDSLRGGGAVLCDCEMVASGITRRFLPADNPVIVTLNDPKTPEMARNLGTTRSAAAVDLWRPHLQGALVVIGNAPTALFRLLEIIAEGGPRPAAIIGIPVGFVGAAESKALLAETADDIPFLVVHGTRGGSAMASSVVNAAALLAGETRQNLGTAS